MHWDYNYKPSHLGLGFVFNLGPGGQPQVPMPVGKHFTGQAISLALLLLL